MEESIKQIALDMQDELVKIRRHLHMHPELSFKEFNTSKYISQYLREIGIKVIEGVAGTGVIGILETGQKGSVVGLRADIDALPVKEDNNVVYKSTIPGVMHACGHDVHTACLLGSARILSLKKDLLKGSVKFIFQPAEEVMLGAQKMIEEGVLNNPEVNAIFGLHTFPEIKSGYVGLKEGPLMAANDVFEIVIKGKGGHGGIPDSGNDAIVAAASVIQNLQHIVSRMVSPIDSVVVSIGAISGGEYPNIICDEISMKGTVRTFNEETQEKVIDLIKNVLSHTCQALRVRGEIDYKKLGPFVINSDILYDLAKNAVQKIVEETGVITPKLFCGGEDFALYQQIIPGFFYFLGSGYADKDSTFSFHHSQYDIDEKCLSIGAAVLAQSAFDYLTQ